MRIGKRKAEGKKRKKEPEDAERGGNKKKLQGHLHELVGSRTPAFATSDTHTPGWDNLTIPGATELATNESLSGFDVMQDLRDSRIQSSIPLGSQQDLSAAFNWEASPFFQQQEQTEIRKEKRNSKLADSVPVAAMLTDVFHDIPNQATVTRKDSSSTDEDK